MTDCVFVPVHEPWSCITHVGGFRTRLDQTSCTVVRGAEKRRDLAVEVASTLSARYHEPTCQTVQEDPDACDCALFDEIAAALQAARRDASRPRCTCSTVPMPIHSSDCGLFANPSRPTPESLIRARELVEYHVPNVHTGKTGRRTVDTIETGDGRTITVCGGCGQEYPCDSRELADMVLAEPEPTAREDELREALWEELRFVKGATDDVIVRLATRLATSSRPAAPELRAALEPDRIVALAAALQEQYQDEIGDMEFALWETDAAKLIAAVPWLAAPSSAPSRSRD